MLPSLPPMICKTLLLLVLLVCLDGVNPGESTSVNDDDERIHLMFILTNVDSNWHIARRFTIYAESLLATTDAAITIHAIVDDGGKRHVRKYFPESVAPRVQVVFYDRDDVTDQILQFVTDMRSHFSSSNTSYYHDAIFFVGPVVYRVLPDTVKRVIITDTDLKFLADIRGLWSRFEQFTDEQVIGLAHDAQPVYYHIFHKHRQANPGTRVGAPPPDGLPGFNSGVMLQDLEKMRDADAYRNVLDPKLVAQLADKYQFKGHLGDQDLYSLLVVEHEHLFHTLPCNWNRQLCRWWERGYQDVFEKFFNCDGPVKIYHGNCGTAIPEGDGTETGGDAGLEKAEL
ncbi:xyloside xylosyltransferase 1-like [Sycon ciliatum]|uniref:xyloside xylosyltransferase 1-like n=1 Tax=Sycon ciliatum TaxID=27933 RepID=UPI0020AEB3CD|eukprot:scpid61528/ scgid15259/ Xyloside xylosyltransferase 1; UDP-xylose:alpha-xyloside alpha-1,3-xylosyltransferase